MGTRHYEDYVVGIGSTGYLKDAAWRCDATWTFLKGKDNLGGFSFNSGKHGLFMDVAE